MRAREQHEINIKYLRLNDACKCYSLGENSMRKVALEAHAVVKIGKCVLIDMKKMDNYLESLAR